MVWSKVHESWIHIYVSSLIRYVILGKSVQFSGHASYHLCNYGNNTLPISKCFDGWVYRTMGFNLKHTVRILRVLLPSYPNYSWLDTWCWIFLAPSSRKRESEVGTRKNPTPAEHRREQRKNVKIGELLDRGSNFVSHSQWTSQRDTKPVSGLGKEVQQGKEIDQRFSTKVSNF